MVHSSPALMALLETARQLELASWCIGAGAVRSLVWDALHVYRQPTHYDDVDVVYHDADTSPQHEAEMLQRLIALKPSVRWEVTNQALVHHWFLTHQSQIVVPLDSLAAGIATWPEYATCVGVNLRADDTIGIIAPHGLDDLFAMRVRHNPARASAATYQQRVQSKRFAERWPQVTII
ncbi:hypothetical protein GJ699_22610 [Duganella sp. FT80W]|uniref:Nucleotidyltransferase family protein n=1 Tax=Duganella guangzhouensis TaxID=2666084 RepID=A0A6I2L399_9BURK|nr:hypothetical protein [Duganella guangzhouensis]